MVFFRSNNKRPVFLIYDDTTSIAFQEKDVIQRWEPEFNSQMMRVMLNDQSVYTIHLTALDRLQQEERYENFIKSR